MMLRVGIFGTFDIGNFGDLLFPIVAEKKLAELGSVTLRRFSYNKMSSAKWCYDVDAIGDLPRVLSELDLILVGGGHLMHFNRHMARGYAPSDAALPHPLGFWWLPAIVGSVARIPVALNCVSSDPKFPKWSDALLTTFMGSLDYTAVRETKTAQRLAAYAPPSKEISIIPDTVFSIPDIIQRGQHSAPFDTFCKDHMLKQPYLVVQPSDALWRQREQIEGYIAAALAKGWQVLELPIGFGIGNKPGFYRTLGVTQVKYWPDPLLLAETIANCEAAIGVSLHLSVVSASYGIPVYRPSYSGESKFILLDGLPNIHFLETAPLLKGFQDERPDLAMVTSYRRKLDTHWRSIKDLAANAHAPTPEKAAAAWRQLVATPEAFRAGRHLVDRRSELMTRLTRQRHFWMHDIRRSLLRR